VYVERSYPIKLIHPPFKVVSIQTIFEIICPPVDDVFLIEE